MEDIYKAYLSQAYQQLIFDDESRKSVVINTQKGLFRYTRVTYGIASSPGILQRVVDNFLQGIREVATYLDDILITGATEEEHLKTSEEVLDRLAKAGLRVQKHKYSFMVPNLGHNTDANGLHPLSDKVTTMEEESKLKEISRS